MPDRQAGETDPAHILIVDRRGIFHSRLRKIFEAAGVSSEGVKTADSGVRRLAEGEPPITGVITESFNGRYPQVLEAAKEAGVAAVLMARSSILIADMRSQGITAFLESTLTAEMPEPGSVAAMLGVLAPTNGNFT